MILRSIELENFGLYAGRQTLDLVPRKRPGGVTPVVLFGGRNGAGKTTLLEAVRLALYGKLALGHRVGQAEYEAHLLSRIHVGVGGRQSGSASVGLEFDYAEAGRIHHYRVVRRWSAKGTRAAETLVLEKDGRPIEGVPRDEWHHFLQELIPIGVSQLFFFDGEKIAEIARDDVDDGLAEAVRGLLGIELVGRLRTDLGLFMIRREVKESGAVGNRLKATLDELAQLEDTISEVKEQVAELTSRRSGQARLAGNLRQRFAAEGGDAASQHARLEATRDETRQQISRRETELRELAGGLLPFTMAPNVVKRLATVLSRSDGNGAAQAAALRERLLAWRGEGDPPRSAVWKEAHWRDLEAFLAFGNRETPMVGEVLSDLGASERALLLHQLREIRESTVARAALIASEMDRLGGRLKDVQGNLVRASGEGAALLGQEIAIADQQLALAEAELKVKDEELKALEFRRTTLKRDRDRLLKAQSESAATQDRAALAGRIGQVLARYEERLLESKLSVLQNEFVRRFNHLARKGGFVADARIDRSTFQTTLIDRDGREIAKSALSAGEKQVYAIAMLWALAHASGRALPMIIDTPLARLDSEHRRSFVERYLPEASHQVIVLSTDTEVDDALLERLKPAVSHTYRLDYDPEHRSTTAHIGYFGDEMEEHRALQQG